MQQSKCFWICALSTSQETYYLIFWDYFSNVSLFSVIFEGNMKKIGKFVEKYWRKDNFKDILKQFYRTVNATWILSKHFRKIDREHQRNFSGILVFCEYFEHFLKFLTSVTGLVIFDESLDSFSSLELKQNSRTSKLLNAAATINGLVLRTDNGLQLWKRFNTPAYKKHSAAHFYIETWVIK